MLLQAAMDPFFVHAGIYPGRPLHRQSADDLLWIREPFLSSRAAHERLIVHGHSPTANRQPDHRPNRLNLDTGAVFRGPLTAAAFGAEQRDPIAFIHSQS
jgi:serine/threonine protein phosphatase 1